MWNPINRTTVQTEENKYRLYAKSGPINYKKSDGTFDTINHTFNDTTSSIGDISLMDKGIMSVGKRKGNNPTKVVGIRPDINQHLGTQQLEFSLVNVELDGESQSFNVETDLEIKLGSANVSQLVKANKDFKDFKVEFDIHNTGLELQNSKYSNTTTIREDFVFNLTELGEIEGGVTNKTLDNIFTEDRDTPFIDSCTFQVTNNYITTGQYSNTEEFGDSDLSNYVIDDSVYPNGGAAYLKDCIVLIAKAHNIDGIEEIFVNQMCNFYGLENFDDGGIGQYLTKDNKKVVSYYSNLENDTLFLFINTKAIPDDVKSLFQKKTFNDTSFLDITLSDFNTTITNYFNNNIEIQLDTNYYQPIDNQFVFKVKNESFYINLPTLFDESYNVLDLGTIHSLKQNDDGTYRYTKYFSMSGYLKNSHNIKYIDADLAANTAPGYESVYTAGGGASLYKYTEANHNTARNASTGTGTNLELSANDSLNNQTGFISVRASGQSGTTYSLNHYQAPFGFDVSGITDTVSSATFKIRGGYNNLGSSAADHHLILLKADIELASSDTKTAFNDYVGFTSDWDSDDVTEYSAEHVVTNTNTSPAFQDITLNADARSDLETFTSEPFELIMVEKEEWYDNSFNHHGLSNTLSSFGRRFFGNMVNSSTAGFKPYIEFETGAASGYGHKVAGVAAASISKVKGVATANIGKVIGVD